MQQAEESNPHADGSREYHVGWHLGGLLGVLLLPSAVSLDRALWNLPSPHFELGAGFVVGYFLAALAIGLLAWWRAAAPGPTAVAVAFGFLLLVSSPLLLVHELEYSRAMLLTGAAFLGIYLPAPHLLRNQGRLTRAGGRIVAIVSVGLTLVPPAGADPGEAVRPDVTAEVRRTTHHVVRVTRYDSALSHREREVAGGAIDRLGDSGDFLLVRGDGALYRVGWSDREIRTRRLEPSVPTNFASFDRRAGQEARRDWFRVADALVMVQGQTTSVLVSHHYWKDSERCFVVRLSRLDVPTRMLTSSEGLRSAQWRTVYDAKPCLPLSERGGMEFGGGRSGGRLAMIDEGRVLLTLGDHHFDGIVNPSRVLSQDTTADYGKTLVVDLGSGNARMFTLGHRNPQGLAIDSSGQSRTIWLTEHGPRGGDELNRVVRGGNYGWPLTSYGSAYGSLSWPGGGSRPEHHREPAYAWTPSIGISNLIEIRGSTFPRWTGDLLVASLRDRAVWRTKTARNRVLFTERIEVGERIRDLVQGADGSIVLWTDSEMLIRLEPAEERERGSAIFAQYCADCHTVGGDAGPTIGPVLDEVYGREIATVEGFDYSEALEELDGSWTRERLDRFLADPQRFAPGTRMMFPGFESPEERRIVVDYLDSVE